ncbi:MAG: phosphate ABC transporter permease subunit PstC [Alphaproteobacteria bacterium]|nr:phosphate ABC transporter permease subunit PstC [Alphaproteobacteria bacterium]
MNDSPSRAAPPRLETAVKAAGARRLERSNTLFRQLTFGSALLVLAIFVGMFCVLLYGAWPALHTFGVSFFTKSVWNPVTEKFGILALVYGTLVTSALAMLMALPVGVGIAVFLTEFCPRPLRRPIGISIELLAGIPSIIYGVWGLFVFAPFFQRTAQPFLVDVFADAPVLSSLFAGPPYGIGLFTASLILAIMILPLITAVTRDVFDTAPSVLKEAAYGLGCMTRETVWKVVIPYARAGVFGGAMLALGRALGETMAVTFVIGNAHRIKASLFAPATTISAAIANEFTEAVGDLYKSSLLAAGFFLLFITFVVLALAQLMLVQLEKRAGGMRV